MFYLRQEGYICGRMCVSDQGTIDYTLRMISIMMRIQDPDNDPKIT